MGRAKAEWLEEQERGWYSVGEKYVCPDCFEDEDIKNFVIDTAESMTCSYCDSQSDHGPIAAPIDAVLELIIDGIKLEWGDPNDEGVSWESREGGWLGEVHDSWDLLSSLEITTNEELFRDLEESIADRQWCQRDFYRLLPHQELESDWQHFSHVIMHEARFVFYRLPGETDRHYGGQEAMPAHLILDTVGRLVLDMELVEPVQTGETYRRARVHKRGLHLSSFNELGPPPRTLARFSNRMSPAGIPMFYGSSDIETALAEIVHGASSNYCATIGTFRTTRDLRLINLANVPAPPGLFNRQHHHDRHLRIFLRRFLESVTRPIVKDGREHIEYVPSQVVTEYFRHVFKDTNGDPVHGLLFPSAAHQGGTSCVLFFGPQTESSFIQDPASADRWLDLVAVDRVELDSYARPGS